MDLTTAKLASMAPVYIYAKNEEGIVLHSLAFS